MRRKNIVVAARSSTCRICKGLRPDAVAEVNAAIWPEPGVAARFRDYRTSAVRVAAAHGLEVEVKSVSRHAQHIERSWHVVDAKSPAKPGELPVFKTDFNSMVDRAATLGAKAMDALDSQMPTLDPKELVAVAKLGVGASVTRESLRLKAQEVDQQSQIIAALGALSSGHISQGDIPETEVIDVTPVEVLLDEVAQEREALARLSAGEAPRV